MKKRKPKAETETKRRPKELWLLYNLYMHKESTKPLHPTPQPLNHLTLLCIHRVGHWKKVQLFFLTFLAAVLNKLDESQAGSEKEKKAVW